MSAALAERWVGRSSTAQDSIFRKAALKRSYRILILPSNAIAFGLRQRPGYGLGKSRVKEMRWTGAIEAMS